MSILDDNAGGHSGYISPAYDISSDNIKKPPLWPLFVQTGSLVTSLVLWTLNLKLSSLLLSSFCYVLTPFVVFGCLAVLRALDLSSRDSVFYDQILGKKYISIAGYISLLSFLVAIPVVYRLATEISQI